jgi:hypothetical protein
VKRECFLYKSSDAFNKHFYIDRASAKDILKVIKTQHPKFNRLRIRVLETENHYYQYYEKTKGFNNITEMRFLGNPNGRIYCREFRAKNGDFCIVLGKCIEYKKSETIDKSIKAQLKVLETYEYEL